MSDVNSFRCPHHYRFSIQACFKLLIAAGVFFSSWASAINIDLTGDLSCESSTSCSVALSGDTIIDATSTLGVIDELNIDIVFNDHKHLEAIVDENDDGLGGEFVFLWNWYLGPTTEDNPEYPSGSATAYLSDENGINIRNLGGDLTYDDEGAGDAKILLAGPGFNELFHDVHISISDIDMGDFPRDGSGPNYQLLFAPESLEIVFSGQGPGRLEIGEWDKPPNGVPITSTLLLFGLGLTGVGWVRRKKT